MAESSLRSKRRNTSSNFCILRSCSHVAWFIVPHFLTGTQNRTTRVLPNPDNSLAYDTGNTSPLKTDPDCDILVSMTRIAKSKLTKPPKRQVRGRRQPGHWLLQDAKARFSELVRRVRSEGPQHVTVHGRDEVVVIAAEEFRRLKGDPTGQALIAALQAAPHRDMDIEPERSRLPVRYIDL